MIVDGLGTCIGALFGSALPTTVHVGHKRHKTIGARAGYSISNAAAFLVLFMSGVFPALVQLVDQASLSLPHASLSHTQVSLSHKSLSHTKVSHPHVTQPSPPYTPPMLSCPNSAQAGERECDAHLRRADDRDAGGRELGDASHARSARRNHDSRLRLGESHTRTLPACVAPLIFLTRLHTPSLPPISTQSPPNLPPISPPISPIRRPSPRLGTTRRMWGYTTLRLAVASWPRSSSRRSFRI